MTLRSQLADHECDENETGDVDICSECGEHTAFCSVCGLSSCCGSGSYDTDPDTDMER